MHGGASTGARSVDGKRRQAEGREHHIRRLRAQGRKPGPPKGTGGRPRKAARVDPVERLRADTLAALDTGLPKKRSAPMPDAPEEGLDGASLSSRPHPSSNVLKPACWNPGDRVRVPSSGAHAGA